MNNNFLWQWFCIRVKFKWIQHVEGKCFSDPVLYYRFNQINLKFWSSVCCLNNLVSIRIELRNSCGFFPLFDLPEPFIYTVNNGKILSQKYCQLIEAIVFLWMWLLIHFAISFLFLRLSLSIRPNDAETWFLANLISYITNNISRSQCAECLFASILAPDLWNPFLYGI